VKYQIQIDNNADFTSPEIDFTELTLVSTPRNGEIYTPASNLSNGLLYWRVKAIDNEGLESDWSESSLGFGIDTIIPASTIKFPDNSNKHFKKVPRIVGASTD
jgi:hypothetical protein